MEKYLRKYWENCTLVLFLYVFKILAQGFCAFFGMWMLEVALSGDIKKLVFTLVINSLCWAVFGIFDWGSNIAQARAIKQMNTAMRFDISQNILEKGYEDFRKQNIGDYISWYTNDLNQAENLGFVTFFSFARDCIAAFIAICALIFIHWSIALITIVMTAIMIITSTLMDKKLRDSSWRVSSGLEKFTGVIKDQISGLFVLKAFGVIKSFCTKINTSSEDLEQNRYGFAKVSENANLVVSFVNIICQFVINVSIFTMSVAGIIPFATIFGGVNITALASNSTHSLVSLRLKLASSKPYFEKLQHKSGISAEATLCNLEPIKSGIHMHNLSFSYGEKSVLCNMNLDFEIGKKYALTGASGCGKTTVLRLILGQLKNYGGTILFDSTDAQNIDPNSLYSQIAYIEQNVFLFDTSIRENITLGHDFSDAQIEKALADSALNRDLSMMENGLDTSVGENAKNLSGGQMQRIAIARALLHNRKILLVDEGTSALDRENADIVESCLLHNADLTLILISHHLNSATRAMFDCVYSL